MKNALFEGAAHRSRDVMARNATPRTESRTLTDLTSYELQPHRLATPHAASIGHPLAPYLTLHQFRKQQLSPIPSSPPSLDYKRVRRKPSFHSNDPGTPISPSSPLMVTSSVPQAHLSSVKPLLPSLFPPSPHTPTSRPTLNAPSLSSTIDTLPSTPTYTPSQRRGSGFGHWCGIEGSERSERSERGAPIHTKRKLSLKQAKRLPHPQAREADGGSRGGIWQVHAAIVDLPDDGPESRNFDGSVRVAEDRVIAQPQKREFELSNQQALPRSDEKKGRSVRFKEENRSQSSEAPLTSSYSLSNSKFPAPSGQRWQGTFGKSLPSRKTVGGLLLAAGHLSEPTPPTSPATLHYKGTSFDLLNPHASLLLGPKEFETPAEIDGLLDDYFDNPEMSDQSPNPSDGSSRRGRQLYDTPNAARREILRLPDDPRVRLENVVTDTVPHSQRAFRQSNRSSSAYAPSQRSNPFDLTISDLDDEEPYVLLPPPLNPRH